MGFEDNPQLNVLTLLGDRLNGVDDDVLNPTLSAEARVDRDNEKAQIEGTILLLRRNVFEGLTIGEKEIGDVRARIQLLKTDSSYRGRLSR